MKKKAIKLTQIDEKLSLLSEKKLDEVIDFIESILSKKNVQQRKNVKLEGIWAGKGFEQIDIKKELNSAKKDLAKSILKKEL